LPKTRKSSSKFRYAEFDAIGLSANSEVVNAAILVGVMYVPALKTSISVADSSLKVLNNVAGNEILFVVIKIGHRASGFILYREDGQQLV
jgi:hypothetical protein